MSVGAIAERLHDRLWKPIEMSIKGQLYEQDAIIQQPEACIQAISSIHAVLMGHLECG